MKALALELYIVRTVIRSMEQVYAAARRSLKVFHHIYTKRSRSMDKKLSFITSSSIIS